MRFFVNTFFLRMLGIPSRDLASCSLLSFSNIPTRVSLEQQFDDYNNNFKILQTMNYYLLIPLFVRAHLKVHDAIYG